MKATTETALALIGSLYPEAWKEAAKTADFDVIAATLDRLQAAAAAGDWKQAESARLEAYGVFELGPEQRLRGLAPVALPGGRGLLLVRRRGLRRPRPAPRPPRCRAGDRRDARGARRCAHPLRAADRQRPAVRRLGHHELGDHRLPRGSRGGPHPGRAHGEPRRRHSAISAGRCSPASASRSSRAR